MPLFVGRSPGRAGVPMSLPFTTNQFLDVFTRYNDAVWPAQLLIYFLGVLCITIALRRGKYAGSVISLILSILWLWMAVFYHFVFFSRINQAAWVFGSLFTLQSLIFVYAGAIAHRLSFHFRRDACGFGGALLLVYALILYPALCYLLGRVYPGAPTFGLPCPTTIFTLGLLLWAMPRIPVYVVVVPLAWSFIGVCAALSLSITEDVGLLIAGLMATLLIVFRKTKSGAAVDPLAR